MSFTVAIVGRPNVGKSTLFNRLTGARHALVDDRPGVTRDRREGEANIGPLTFTIVDTAGMEKADADTLAGRMLQQTRAALSQADVIMLVVDARVGIQSEDRHFAAMVREANKPVVLVINKAEGKKAKESLNDFYTLGLGEPVAISAEHGEGMGDLYDVLAPFARDENEEEEKAPQPMQIAVVGRPNVGKSTFINALLGESRLLTGPEAGVTRDAIAVPFTWEDKPVKLVDTAGMRKKANVQEKLEKMATDDSRRAIQYANVCILMLDATVPIEKQDSQIGALIEEEGRGCLLALNKWDLVEDPKAVMEEMTHQLFYVLPQFKNMPIIPCSAERGWGMDDVMRAAHQVYESWNRRIPTGELNRWLEVVMEAHTPPLVKGRRLKVKYMTQTKARPPSFALFTSNKAELPESYRRYLANQLREDFKLYGVPIRFLLRTGKNPYDKS